MKNRTLIFTSALLASSLASATAQTWTSAAGGNWSDGLNWDTTPTAPANDGTADIVFDSNPATLTSTIDAPYSINSLTFGTGSGNWAISGSALTIGAGGIVNALQYLGSNSTVSAPIIIGASQTWETTNLADGNNRIINLSGTITGTSDKTITVSGDQDLLRYRAFRILASNTATLASNFIVDAGGRLANGVNITNGFGTGTITINTDGMVGGLNGGSNWANNMTLAGGALGALGDGGGGTHNGNLTISSDSFTNMTRGSDGVVIGGGTTSLVSGSGNLTQNIDTGTTTKTTYIGNTGSSVNNTNTGTLTINAGRVWFQKADNTVAWGGNIVINSDGILVYNDFRENQIADTATVTINEGGVWNMSHGGSLNHEKITGLVVNTTGTAFTNDTSAGGSRIVLGTGVSSAGAAGIFVNSSGSLSGTGIVNKATTVDGGTLTPGDGAVGTLSFSSGLTFGAAVAADSLVYELGAPTTAGVDYDTVVTDNLALGGGTLGFSSFQFTNTGSLAVGVYTLVSSANLITGTLGTPSGTIGAFTGTLSISGGGTDLILTVTAGGASAYDTWAGGPFANPFTNTTPTVDFELDGLTSLMEFVLGGDPTINDTPSIVPFVTASGSDMVITFKRSDASELQPVTVKVQVSSDLATWNPADDITIGATNGSGPNGATYTVDETGTLDTIVVTIPKAAATKKFARVIATQ